MEKNIKEQLIKMFRSFIRKLKSDYCQQLSPEQLEKLIDGLNLIREVEETIIIEKRKKSRWRFW